MNSNLDLPAHTVDAFHHGRFVVVQPKHNGHRSGIDAMLLASLVPSNFSGTLVDLGSGAGAAGMAVASRCLHAHVTFVEKDPTMVSFAVASANHPSNHEFHHRLAVIQSDICATGNVRVASGLLDNAFDFAIMNPPFNMPRDRKTPDQRKADAHVMHEGLFESWVRTSAAILKANGKIAIIARPQSLPEIFTAMKNRFGGIKIIPILAREHEPAIRILVYAVKGSRADLALMPPLILHGSSGNGFLEPAENICNGLAGLFE